MSTKITKTTKTIKTKKSKKVKATDTSDMERDLEESTFCNIYQDVIGLPPLPVNKYGMEYNFRLLILSHTNGGKGELFMNLLHELERNFIHVWIVCKTNDEEIYQWMWDELDHSWFTISKHTPTYEMVQKGWLLVLDDQTLETRSTKNNITNYENNLEIMHWGRKKISIMMMGHHVVGMPGQMLGCFSDFMFHGADIKDMTILQKLAGLEGDQKLWDKYWRESTMKNKWVHINKGIDDIEERISIIV